MTNFQGSPKRGISQKQVLLGFPMVLGFGVAIALAGVWAWPQWTRLQLAEQELQQLDEQRQRLPILRAQLTKLARDQAEAELRQDQILGLVAGSGDIATFMTQLSEEAQRVGVQLDGYEPIIETATAEGAKSNRAASKADQSKASAVPPDPLLAPGLMKTSLLLVARGDGPQLLAFLRRLESLSLLVVQSNLQVKAEQKGTAKDGMSRPALRINLGLYSLAPKVQAVKQAVKR
jgi:type IV pilus assembly protein PilO